MHSVHENNNYTIDLSRILQINGTVLSFSKKKADGEMDWELEDRLRSRCIWATGQKGLTEREAAACIVGEAKGLLKDDLLRMGIEWKPNMGISILPFSIV